MQQFHVDARKALLSCKIRGNPANFGWFINYLHDCSLVKHMLTHESRRPHVKRKILENALRFTDDTKTQFDWTLAIADIQCPVKTSNTFR